MGIRIDEELEKLQSTSIKDIAPEEKGTTLNGADINALKSQTELEALIIENSIKAEDLRSKEQDRKERKIYARLSLGFLTLYMTVVFLILFFSGFKTHGFELKQPVLIALITTTTANVIGIFAFVMKYLFNSGSKIKKG